MLDKEFFVSGNYGNNYLSSDGYEQEYTKEYDNEIDKLRDEVYSCVLDIEEKEKEIKFINNDIRILKVQLKKIPMEIVKSIIVFIVMAMMYRYVMAGRSLGDIRDVMNGIFLCILAFGVVKVIYQGIYDTKPDMVIRIKIFTKHESIANQIEEKERLVEIYERTIIEEKEKIQNLRKRIATLEAEEN